MIWFAMKRPRKKSAVKFRELVYRKNIRNVFDLDTNPNQNGVDRVGNSPERIIHEEESGTAARLNEKSNQYKKPSIFIFFS